MLNTITKHFEASMLPYTAGPARFTTCPPLLRPSVVIRQFRHIESALSCELAARPLHCARVIEA